MWRVISLSLCLLLLSSFLPCSLSWGESIRERAQNELIILKTQLVGCKQIINTLKAAIEDLKKINENYKQITTDLQTQLDALKAELETQENLYKTLSKQSDDLKKYITRLETERDIAIGIAVGTGVVAVVAGIWALAERNK